MTASESARIVPSNRASLGMMLLRVPAWNIPTVITTGSKASNCRVASVCNPTTISAATTIGSAAECGRDACPPAPRTVTDRAGRRRHQRSRPGREHPARQHAGEDVQPVRRRDPGSGGVQHSFADHGGGAVPALLAGLEHEDHVTGERGHAAGSAASRPRRAPRCAGRARRRAWCRATPRTARRSPR